VRRVTIRAGSFYKLIVACFLLRDHFKTKEAADGLWYDTPRVRGGWWGRTFRACFRQGGAGRREVVPMSWIPALTTLLFSGIGYTVTAMVMASRSRPMAMGSTPVAVPILLPMPAE